MAIRKVEIDFAIPVDLTDKEMQTLCEIAQAAAKRHEPEGMVHWQSGCGSKPHFSVADSHFLGKEPEDGAPESGEPTFEDDVFYIETFARERYPNE